MYKIKVNGLEVLDNQKFKLDGEEGNCLQIAADVVYDFFESQIVFFDNIFDHSDIEKVLKESNSFGFFDREEGGETITELRFDLCEDYLGSELFSSLDHICVEDEQFMEGAFEEFRSEIESQFFDHHGLNFQLFNSIKTFEDLEFFYKDAKTQAVISGLSELLISEMICHLSTLQED